MRAPRSVLRGPQYAGWVPAVPPARAFAVRIVANVSIPLSDGTLLGADLYLPDTGERLPALLGWSPYNKDLFPTGAPAPFNEPGDVTFLASCGYPLVIVNTRGTGRSTGELPKAMFDSSEVDDMRQVFTWIAGQPWCDGRVAMTGMSYFGISQLFAAGHGMPGLAAVAPFGSATDIYRMVAYQNGTLHSGFLSPYIAVNGSVQRIRLPVALRHALGYLVGTAPVQAVTRKALWGNLHRLIRHLSPSEPWLRRWAAYCLEHPLDGPFYREASAWSRLSDIEVPVLLGTEWSMVGLHLPGTFEAWHGIRGPKKMFIGPRWDQWPFLRYQKEIVSYYDHVIKGIDNGYDRLPPVRYWLHGAERWESAEDWPPPGAARWSFFLDAGQGGNSRLSTEPPAGGRSLSWASLPVGLSYPGAFDRYGPYPQVLRYESDPASRDIHIAGPAEITLQLSCTAIDTHVQVRLSDLAPDGTVSVVSVGWLLASHRTIDEKRSTPTEIIHDHAHPVPLEPGKPHSLRFSLFPFAQLLRKGHRLVLEIGSDPARLAPGTKDRFVYFGNAGTPYPALNTIHHSGGDHSLLRLTVRPPAGDARAP
ncbi:MAG: CocE/NonD family hydrolase [Rhizobiaceae bacterium]|nr:CocE/NonD family hydrolase [Rhizobiaceae bacterium]MCV0407453.1 CocE/NonD family hydrolase [Rhizobiaceae bacterium]